MTLEPVAVVGLACVFPGAADAGEFWRNIAGGVDAIAPLPPERCDPEMFAFATDRGGFVGGEALWFEPGRFGVVPKAVADIDPDQLLALSTAAAALDDAGLAAGDVDSERIGVVLGRGGYLTPGGAQIVQRVRTAQQLLVCLRTLLPELDEERRVAVKDAFVDQLGALDHEAAVGAMPNLSASLIANRLDLGGPAYLVDAACASSLVAVDAALGELRAGRCDLMLAGGVHHCDDVMLWAAFDQLGALSASSTIRPYSRHADGILIGEGTGVLALERVADAERLGHRVYAVLRGVGMSSDGREASVLSPGVGGQVLALERAYRATGVDPATIELVEGHGTATPTGDKAELETLRRVFGGHGGAGPRHVLGSVKSMIGHAMPAAGAAGLIKTVLAVHHRVLPPTLHGDEPHPALADTRFRLLDRAEPWERPAGQPRRAGVNAFGFGGINSHVIVEEHRPAAPRRRTGQQRADARFDVEAILLAGVDAADLAARLDSAHPRRGLVPEGEGPARLAVVDPTPRRLELAARMVAKGRPWRGRNDVWFEPEGLVSGGGQVAFLFPGVEPTFDADLAPVAAAFDRPLRPVPEGASPLEAQGHQILAAGRLLHDVLTDLGLRPDHIAGHSMGEWTGWYASELIPRDRADDYLDQLTPGVLEVPGVVYLALGCGVERTAELIDGLADVVVSHDNCPHQSVVCGSPETIATVGARAAAAQVVGQELPFRSGFHSPAFGPYVERIRPLWERMPAQAPRVPIWSATTCDRYPDSVSAVRDLAGEHLVRPVRFRELTERLYAAGARVFVQAGVGSLVGFVDDTLRDLPHLAISAHVGTRSGLDQLARVAAALWVEGAAVDLAAPAAPRPTGHRVRLSLGTPLVHLPAAARLDVAVSVGLPPPALAAGLAASHTALLDETRRAALDVGQALSRRAGTALRVDIDSYPWLRDHCIVKQRDGWPEVADGFPVVPMTGLVEVIADAARAAAPGRTVTRIDDVTVTRFVTAAPATEARLRTTREAPDRLQVEIEGYARATVHLATTAPPAPAPSAAPLANPRSSPRDAAALYDELWMFHGPRFQGVRSLDALGDDGIDGAVEVMPTPGATLDSAAQIYGWWVLVNHPRNFFTLPQSIERIDLFGALVPGELLATTVRITELTDQLVRADLELIRDGRVVVRLRGSTVRRYNSDGHSWALNRDPGRRLMASVTPGGVVLVDERWRDPASRELMAYRFLTGAEREAYRALKPLAQRHWLLGRIAAKDAVRHALLQAGHDEVFPAEITIANDDRGRPYVASAPGDGATLDLSISHTSWVGAAIVAPRGRAAGVDVEAIEPQAAQLATVMDDAELALAGPDGPTDRWLVRAWAAKEAAAKAAGTGLAGRPRDFPIRAEGCDRLLVGDRWIRTRFTRAPVQAVPGACTGPLDPDPAPPDETADDNKEFVIAWTDPHP